MKLKTKIQKLDEAEKYAETKRAEISRELLDVIQRQNINIVKLCEAVKLSRDKYYYYAKKLAFPTEILKKFSQTEVFKQIDV